MSRTITSIHTDNDHDFCDCLVDCVALDMYKKIYMYTQTPNDDGNGSIEERREKEVHSHFYSHHLRHHRHHHHYLLLLRLFIKNTLQNLVIVVIVLAELNRLYTLYQITVLTRKRYKMVFFC